MAGRALNEEQEDYAEFLARKYGLGPLGKEDELEAQDGATTSTQAAPYPEGRRPSATRPASRSLGNVPSWQRLSRNRAAKRASVDFTQHQHLSTMYHMHRRIAEMYQKSGLVRQAEDEEPRMASGRGCIEASAGRPTSSVVAPRCMSVSSMPGTRINRPSTAPSAGGMRAPPMQQGQQEAGVAVPVQEAAAPPQQPPSYSKRRVQNTAAALKTAILDEVVAHRIYEGNRLKALFRSYLKLNAGESFFPTLQQVIEELGVELGVA